MHTFAALVLLLFIIFTTNCSCFPATSSAESSVLASCLAAAGVRNFSLAADPPPVSYTDLLDFSIQNLRFSLPDVPKPVAVILPGSKEQLRDAVLCVRRASLVIRVRSGGHSYEGLSYTIAAAPHRGDPPFAVVDLMNLNRVRVDPAESTAWAESGATLGEIYYSVAESSRSTLAFPAGSCSTIGSGGHISGGGFGFLSRKFGLAADNVIDAVMIDAVGRILDRQSMGEDAFWAIRGGGGGSWGVVYAWKLRLVPVPDRVALLTVDRPGPSRLVAELVDTWQRVGPSLPDEFYLSVFLAGSTRGNATASFTGLFLGPKNSAMSVLSQRFPELRAEESDWAELTWAESAAQLAGLGSTSELTSRVSHGKGFFKAKSDYVRTPIPLYGIIRAVEMLSDEPSAYMILDPYGGAMARIESGALPFPHRAGNLYGIQYQVGWTAQNNSREAAYVAWIRAFYEFMRPFVSKNPRAAYVNYVDLDLGTDEWSGGGLNGGSMDAVHRARTWGEKYFMGNFDRLVRAKTIIDPHNVFNNAQSIPPLPN
ncbi:reticuline oxidase-like [Ananas comosus]|uniref:Reticuline oxidase-like n=1 Tax=Ananas comosus TaxID=4615 RepID=A0A6P5H6T8_ANACO|nr:reticuline oxidase-like [Ananas comosus]